MSNELTAPQSFEDKMKARIKESIGDLITDEQLIKIIETSMKEVFFQSTYKTNPNGYGNRVEVEPFIHTLTKQLLTERMTTLVTAYIREHEAEIAPVIEKIVREGAGKIFMDAITLQFQGPLATLDMNIRNMMLQATGRTF